ncbi:hypothetical protein HWV62_32517 [Athelia sp. TMB]|nr:hypothetical protein HWV62_32517 [Athelia sp. TMB]
MPSLPPIHGAYLVGATDFTVPLHSTTYIGSAKFKDGTPALALEEVAFTAFYPAAAPTHTDRPLNWLGRPIPVAHNAPLRPPPGPAPYPLVLFSHGLGGTRTSYAAVCARLAAAGRVVLALEHRDGTGPACVWGARTLFYIQDDAVVCGGDGDGPMPLRTDQLAMRRAEVYAAYDAFRALVDPAHTPLHAVHTAEEDRVDLKSWEGGVQAGAVVVLAGHSFGGATVLSILANPPPAQHARIPVTHALALDPWLEPLAASFPGPLPDEPTLLTDATTSTATVNDASPTVSDAAVAQHLKPAPQNGQPRMLVLNSEGFTLWTAHFERLRGVVRAWGRVLTLVRAEHISFSDFPLLPLLRRARGAALMDRTVELAHAFLGGRVDEVLKGMGARVREMEVVEAAGKGGKGKRRLVGEVGDVVVH